MVRVLVADSLSARGIELLRGCEGFRVDVRKGMNEETLREVLPNYEALLVRGRTPVSAALLDTAPGLKAVGRAGLGLRHIDVEAATARGVAVFHSPDGNAISTAEHTLGMMFALARHIPRAAQDLREGRWERPRLMGVELHGKVLGVIGLGNVGAIVADRARSLRMRVLGHDPRLSPGMASALDIESVTLDRILEEADFVSVHVPFNRHTRDLIDEAAFGRMKNGVRLINCAADGIVNEAALYQAILAGKVAGAALDVYPSESEVRETLLSRPEVVATPRIAASTFEAQVRVATRIAEQLRDFFLYGDSRRAVNARALAR